MIDLTSTYSTHTVPGNIFITTQWTRVLGARGDSPESKAALSDL
ncbi:MAG: hypothetical protein ABJC04_08670 [Verrucomicrobiota bacterium]